MRWVVVALCVCSVAAPAAAAPGLDEKVYGAILEPNVTEIETRYGRLTGGPADGEDAFVAELSHTFGRSIYGAALFSFDRDPGGRRRLDAVGAEAIVPLGRIDRLGLDVALYGEYEAVRGGADNLETKLLLQHRQGPFDLRLNLIAEKPLAHGQAVGLRYGASADWQAIGDLRLGVEAFGDLGTTRSFLPRAEHYAGPIVKTELEHLPGHGEIQIEAGYLFALGAARDEARGQARLLLEYEFHF